MKSFSEEDFSRKINRNKRSGCEGGGRSVGRGAPAVARATGAPCLELGEAQPGGPHHLAREANGRRS